MAAYGLDVLDPRVSPRRIAALAGRVPPWARKPGQDWSTEAELLALVVDHLAWLTYVTMRVAGVKSAQKPRPLPRPRREPARAPGPVSAPDSAAPARAGSWLEAAGMLGRIPGVITRTDDG